MPPPTTSTNKATPKHQTFLCNYSHKKKKTQNPKPKKPQTIHIVKKYHN